MLEEFALLQGADGRIDEINRRLKAYSVSLAPVTRPDQLSGLDASRRLAQMIKLLNKPGQNPALRKRLLATFSLFSKKLENDSENTELILNAATELSGKKFGSIREMNEWIASQDAGEWEPLTLYGISVDPKAP
jgi:hypothetical protein